MVQTFPVSSGTSDGTPGRSDRHPGTRCAAAPGPDSNVTRDRRPPEEQELHDVTRVRVLGPVHVLDTEGAPVPLSGSRTVALITRLALTAGACVPAEVLLDDIWEGRFPEGGVATLRRLASRTRTRLTEHHLDIGPIPDGGGYQLMLKPEQVDALRFERLAEEGAHLLRENLPTRAYDTLTQALSLWVGTPLSGVESEFALREAARLEELHLQVQEDRLLTVSALEGPDAAVNGLQSLAHSFPLRERTHSLLMRALHDSGQRGAALAVYDKLRHSLAEELGVAPDQRITTLRTEILRDDQAAPSGWRSPYLTQAVGRDRETGQIRECFERTRLVTLTGTGGVGKTRLAAEYAVRITEAPPGHDPTRRVCFVELAALQHGDSLIEAVSASLSTHDAFLSSRSNTHVARITSALSSTPTLLILDNCEHIIEPAAVLAAKILAACPHLQILATSREPLMTPGEAVLRVQPLPLTDGDEDGGAVELFAQLAGLSDLDFRLHKGNRALVKDICRRLDGLPLAIELAAARAGSMGLEGIANHLDETFQLLSSTRRTGSSRHRSLNAVLDWTWNLLSPEERVLARRVAWLPAGASSQTARHVCASHGLAEEEIPFLLSSLADRSLLTASTSAGAPSDYRLLDTTRRYLLRRLDEAGETSLTARSAAEFFQAKIQDAFQGLLHSRQTESLSWLDTEHDNIVEVMRHLDRAEDLMPFVLPMSWYWIIRGRVDEMSRWLRELMSARDTLPSDIVAILDLIASLCPGEKSSTEPPPWSAINADMLGIFPPLVMIASKFALLADDTAAVAWLVDMAQDHETAWVRAAGHAVRSLAAERLGDTESAEEHAQVAANEFDRIGERWSASHMVTLIAGHRSRRGDLEGAIDALRDAVAMEGHSGVVTSSAQVELGRFLVRAGRTEEGRHELLRTLGPARNTSTEYQILAFVGLMDAALNDGDTHAAEKWLDKAREVMTRPVVDPGYLKAELELAMARLYLRRGQTKLAEEATHHAATAVDGIGDPALTAEVVEMTASVLDAVRTSQAGITGPGPRAVEE